MDDEITLDRNVALFFAFFNEVGIVSQLSRTLLEARLPDGMTAGHFTVLNHLIRVADGRTPLELARAFQVPKTSMTHTLTGLERRGLIDVRPNPDDGRSKQVWLTAKGRRFRNSAITRFGRDVDRLSDRINADKVANLLPDLTAIREVLDADRD